MGHSDWGMIRTRYGRWIPEVDSSIQEKIKGVFIEDKHKDDEDQKTPTSSEYKPK